MHYLKYISFLLLTAIMITSCSKENIDEEGIIPEIPDPIETEINPLMNRNLSSAGEGLFFDCFVIEYPFSVIDNEDNTYEINSEADFETIILDSLNFIVDFVYPITVTDSEGNIFDVANVDDLGELYASCIPDGGWEDGDFPAYLINYDNSCHTIVFPIQLKRFSGEIITVNRPLLQQ